MMNEALGFPKHHFCTQNSFFEKFERSCSSRCNEMFLLVLIKQHLVLLQLGTWQSCQQRLTHLENDKRNQELLPDISTRRISVPFPCIHEDRLQLSLQHVPAIVQDCGCFLSLQNYFLQKQINQNMFSPQWIFMGFQISLHTSACVIRLQVGQVSIGELQMWEPRENAWCFWFIWVLAF